MRSFSTCLVALATLAGATAVSYAADLPGTPTKAPAVVKVPSWQGFYLGVNAGYGFSRGDVTEGTGAPGFVISQQFRPRHVRLRGRRADRLQLDGHAGRAARL
jgi:opacity protein-like surface antigen